MDETKIYLNIYEDCDVYGVEIVNNINKEKLDFFGGFLPDAELANDIAEDYASIIQYVFDACNVNAKVSINNKETANNGHYV